MLHTAHNEGTDEENEIEKLREIISNYFEVGGDCYYYVLTRVKEAFQIGTMHFDDFQEFDEGIIDDLVSYIAKKWKET